MLMMVPLPRVRKRPGASSLLLRFPPAFVLGLLRGWLAGWLADRRRRQLTAGGVVVVAVASLLANGQGLAVRSMAGL